MYRTCNPNQWLAITGVGIKNVKIAKSAFIWPLQQSSRFSIQPMDYVLDLRVMSKEKLDFLVPVVFTIGPAADPHNINESDDSLLKYATFLCNGDDDQASRRENLDEVKKVITGIIEGETRVLISSMTVAEINSERELFKNRVNRNIQSELHRWGLRIWNANIKDFRDVPGSSYFASLSRKAHEGATNQARIDVAEAQYLGNVGEARRRGQQETEIAKIHAETAVQKTLRDGESAEASAGLAIRQANLDRDLETTRITNQRAVQCTDEDLKKQVEVKRAAAELERLRATDVVRATIAKESQQQAADAAAYKVAADAQARQEAEQRDADAHAYRVRLEADAASYAAQQAADAEIVRRLKEAEGVAAMADAYGKMAAALGGPEGLIKYLMIEKGTYVELARANADAIRGLEPKISVWNTGATGSGAGADPAETMRNAYQMLPPLMTTINEQTGITLPEWQFGKLNAAQQAIQKEQQ